MKTTKTLVLPRASSRKSKKFKKTVLDGLSRLERDLYDRIGEDVDYVDHPSFAWAATEKMLFGPDAETVAVRRWTHLPEVPDEMSMTGQARKALTAQQEGAVFLRYNYARYRLSKLVEAQRRRKSLLRARQMVLWFRRVMDSRCDIVAANMALVLAMAKRTRIPTVEFSELISEGNMALLRSVEKFDVSRGFKFSTYACRAILKGYNRLATKTGRYRQRFPTEFDPALEPSDYDVYKHEMQHADTLSALREILGLNRAGLSRVEQTIVRERFALGRQGKRRTLAEVGRMVGLTNERVRQIQDLALGKIRTTLNDTYLAV